MNALPARVAGVERLVMVTPMPYGVANDLVLAAAWRAGIDEVWAIGGAQAVAALAFGTHSIRPVDKITGPGNAWVATAKRQVFGQVGIDSIAGPSEVLIMADAQNNPDWIAMDLMAQAEHDELAQSILITDDEDFANAVSDAVDHILTTLPRKEIAGRHGGIMVPLLPLLTGQKALLLPISLLRNIWKLLCLMPKQSAIRSNMQAPFLSVPIPLKRLVIM